MLITSITSINIINFFNDFIEVSLSKKHHCFRLLNLLKSTGVVLNFPVSNLSTLFFQMLKPPRTFFNLSKSSLYTLDFKLGKSSFFIQI